MPIVYEPAQPVSPAISTGYGALQQENIDWDRQYKLAALQAELTSRNLGRGGGGGGGLGGGFRGDQGSALNPQGAADPMALQQNAAALHEQAAMSIQANALSQSEAIQLQRMQQADGYIRQQVEANTLTPDEAQDALMRLHTGISTLQQRQARVQAQRMQQQVQLEQQQAARQASIARLNEQYLNARPQDLYGRDNDPEIEEQVRSEYEAQFPDGVREQAEQDPQFAAGVGWNESAIQEEIRRRGGERQWFQDRPGHRQIISGGTVGGPSRSRQSEEREMSARDAEAHMAHWIQQYRHVEDAINRDVNLQGTEHNQERRDRINSSMEGFRQAYEAEQRRLREESPAIREARRRAGWAGEATRRPGEPRVPANTPPERREEINRAINNRRMVEDFLRRSGDRRRPEDLPQEEIDRLLGRNRESAQPEAASRGGPSGLPRWLSMGE